MSTNYDIAANFADNYNETYFHWLEDTIQESLSDEQIIEKFKIYEPFWNEEDIRFIISSGSLRGSVRLRRQGGN